MERLVGEDDDLEVNSMYKAFLTHFPDQYNTLKTKGGFICVPKSAIMQGVQINKALIDGHIFLSSPLYVGQFTSLSGNKAREEDGGKVISVTDKYGEKRVHVLSQEELYSDDKTIRVLVVDGFLTDVVADETYANMGPQEIRRLKHQQYVLSKLPTRAAYADCTEFLCSATRTSLHTVTKVRETLSVFCNSHHFVRGFEEYTVGKVRDLVRMAEDSFFGAVPEFRRMRKVPRYALQLKLIVECFVLGNIHDVIWDGLTRCFKEEDALLCHQMRVINTLSPTVDIGLKKELLGKVPEASDILNEITSCKTPIEMLDVFQKVVDHFSKKDTLSKSPSEAGGSGSSSGSNSISSATFTEALDDQSSKGANTAKDTEFKSSNSTATTILAGDDVLPALVCTLTHSASPNMYTTCFYIDNFLFFDLSSASLGYVHATLKAAVEYISHTYETLPEEKKATDDKDFFECSDKLCAEEQPQRKNSDKHPPPLMNPPLATVTAAPLPGAATRMFDKAPCLGVGTDPRSDEGLVDFLQVHKRAQK